MQSTTQKGTLRGRGASQVKAPMKEIVIKSLEDAYLAIWDMLEALGYDWITINDFPFDEGIIFYKDGKRVLSIWEKGEQDKEGDVIIKEIKIVIEGE